MQPLLKGTAIVTIATSEFVVVVADKLGYTQSFRGIEPATDPIQKVFSWANRILVASAGKMRLSGKRDAGFDATTGKFRRVEVEYKFETWISGFCASQRTDSGVSPLEFAERIFEAVREPFQPIETIAESGSWRDDDPGNPIVIYTVAGFTKDFTEFGIYQCEIQLNPKNNGLIYVPPLHHPEKIHLTGQTEYIARVLAKKEPWLGLFEALCNRHAADVGALFPDAHPDIKEAIVDAVGLVRVQHEFAKETVGDSVTIAFVDRTSRQAILGSL